MWYTRRALFAYQMSDPSFRASHLLRLHLQSLTNTVKSMLLIAVIRQLLAVLQ